MKRHLITLSLSLAAMFCMGALGVGAIAQGLVGFYNGPATLISYGGGGNSVPLPANEPGTFYFGLLTSATPTGQFLFTGVYATNTAAAGRFGSAAYTPTATGWAPRATNFYEVVGWSADLGTTFHPEWLTGTFSQFPKSWWFGISSIASGVAGGTTPPAKLSVSVSGGTIIISWTPTGGSLQSSPVLGAGETWTTVGTANPATVTISGNAKFFRVVPALDLFGPSGLQGFNLIFNAWI